MQVMGSILALKATADAASTSGPTKRTNVYPFTPQIGTNSLTEKLELWDKESKGRCSQRAQLFFSGEFLSQYISLNYYQTDRSILKARSHRAEVKAKLFFDV